jgi:hypothetical protein
MTDLFQCFGVDYVEKQKWSLSDWIYEALVQSGSHFDGHIEIEKMKLLELKTSTLLQLGIIRYSITSDILTHANEAIMRINSQAFITSKGKDEIYIIYPGQGMTVEEIAEDLVKKRSGNMGGGRIDE